MTKLPVISSKEAIKALIRAGFEYAPKRGKGSHVAMMKTETGQNTRLVIIPKRKALPKGTLRAILDQVGLTKENFLELLSK